jgi:hypothetical protein
VIVRSDLPRRVQLAATIARRSAASAELAMPVILEATPAQLALLDDTVDRPHTVVRDPDRPWEVLAIGLVPQPPLRRFFAHLEMRAKEDS